MIKKKSKIEVYRTHIVINDYKLGNSKSLENCFTIFDPITHTYSYQGIEYIPKENKLIIPRGLDLYFIEGIFEENSEMIDTYDEFIKFDDIQLKYLPRDNVQKEALKFMLGVDKYKRNLYSPQLSLNLPTGKGKTYCSIAASAYCGIKTMIITYSTKWLQQWKEFILEYTNTKESEICMMISSPKILRTMKEDPNKYKFILTSHSSLNSYAKAHGWDAITELFKTLKIGIKFYDEAHLNFNTMSKIDFYTNTYKTYYVTATPARSDERENKIFQFYMKNVPGIDLFNPEEDPHTHYMAIRFNSKPSLEVLQSCRNQYGLDVNKYVNYLVHNENFYKILRVIMDIIITKGGKTLICVKTLEAIDIIYQWIINEYPEFSYNTCILTSNTTDKTVIMMNKIILSTIKSSGTAVDIPYLQRTIILAEPFKSEVYAKQTLGRTRGKGTEYIEIVDKGFNMINKWFLYKKPIFEKYALSCKVINITNKELDRLNEEIIKRRTLFVPQRPIVLRHPKPLQYLE